MGGGWWLVVPLGGVVVSAMGCAGDVGHWLYGFMVAWVVRIKNNKKL